MTKDKTLRLSGSELDAAIAESRGWEWWHYDESKLNTMLQPPTALIGWVRGRVDGYRDFYIPSFQDIADAWELVEEIDMFDHYSLVKDSVYKIGHYRNLDFGDFVIDATGETAPEVIGRVYLLEKEKGGDVE